MKDNKLIAEFMGHKLGLDGDGMGDPQSRIFEKGLGTQRIEDTYSKSWDWLMPVVRRIVIDVVPFSRIEDVYREHLIVVVPFARIEDVYEVAVEFINEYNKHNL